MSNYKKHVCDVGVSNHCDYPYVYKCTSGKLRGKCAVDEAIFARDPGCKRYCDTSAKAPNVRRVDTHEYFADNPNLYYQQFEKIDTPFYAGSQ